MSTRGRRGPARSVLNLVLLAAVITLALAGCASKSKPHATAGGGPPGPTNVTFRAFAANGDLAVPVADVARGECWTTSIAAPGADAYRCFQGNKILDPCFASAHPKAPVQVACLAAPWSRALMLTVSGALPPSPTPSASVRPWAFQLAGGVRCVASTGTVPAIGQVNLGYRCADGGNAAFTGPDSGTASYAAAGATTLRTVAVTTIWHA